jgi:hypothetical protein
MFFAGVTPRGGDDRGVLKQCFRSKQIYGSKPEARNATDQRYD